MLQPSWLRRFVLVLIAAILVVPSLSSPVSAQPRGLDVPYVPTPENIVDAMLRLAKPGPQDFLIDLGCGDGRLPITAAKQFGTRGLGIDLNPVRIIEAKANAEKAAVTDKVEFLLGDLFEADFSRATVLTLYLLPQINMQLRKQILAMKPGTRVVSHAFDFEDWEADVAEQHGVRRVYFWVVPAKVSGWWSGTVDGVDFEVELKQHFQKLSGVSRAGELRAPIEAGRVSGEIVSFEARLGEGRQKVLAGRLEGMSIVGDGWVLKRT